MTARGNISLLNAVTAFYIDGRSLLESAQSAGVQIDVLEYTIRQGGGPLAAALLEFNGQQRGRGTGVMRVKPMSPIEAGTISSVDRSVDLVD